MKLLANRKQLAAALSSVSGVIPSRSPKPVLMNSRLSVSEAGATLSASDLELGVRAVVAGVKMDRPGSALLSPRFGQILSASSDDELSIAADTDGIDVRGLRAKFRLPAEDPDLFPDVPEFAAASYHVVGAADLKRMIKRTIFATDESSTRYALGGALFEFTPDTLALIATDGRRLAKATADCEAEGSPEVPGMPVLPVKALRLLDKLLDADDPAVHVAITSNNALFRTATATVYTRLVEGRFPRYQDVFPGEPRAKVGVACGELRRAVEQASIVTNDESRGVDFNFGPGALTLAATAADVGSSSVECPLDLAGDPAELTLDPRYLLDALKGFDEADRLDVHLIDHKNAAHFKVDSWDYVIMPLTRER